METENFDIKDINYNFILMNHLNRLSSLTILSESENISISKTENFARPENFRESSFDWGISFLRALIPENMIDEQFKKDSTLIPRGNLKKNEYQNAINFKRLRAIINLLDRKGLLLEKQELIKFLPRTKKGPETQEDWEN